MPPAASPPPKLVLVKTIPLRFTCSWPNCVAKEVEEPPASELKEDEAFVVNSAVTEAGNVGTLAYGSRDPRLNKSSLPILTE